MAEDLRDMPAVHELSLVGLIARVQLAERLKEVVRPSNEQQLVLDSEAAAKKAVAEQLQAIAAANGSGSMTSHEKGRAKEFLEEQLKAAIKANAVEAKIAKLKELLEAVQKASNAEEAPHVRKAKQALAAAEKDFEAIHKDYEKWEKGKKMMSVDELNVLKRTHTEKQNRAEAARLLLSQQLERKAEAAAPPPAALGPARGAAATSLDPKGAKPKTVVASGSAPVRVVSSASRATGGYPLAPAAPAPSAASLRQAQIATQVRAEAEEAEPQRAVQRPRAAPKAEEEGPVLSYACTCLAVAQHLGIKEAAARDLAQSSSEFKSHFDAETWRKLQESSLAIEKQQREAKKEAEKRKTAAALAKVTEAESAAAQPIPKTAAPGAKAQMSRPPPPGASAPAAKAAAAKPKAKPPPSLRKSQGLDALAHGNRFGGFEDDDDDEDGWNKVRR